jgi:hypothetical protein
MSKKTRLYKVVGLSAPASFTLFHENDHCWAKSGLPKDRYNELFKWAKTDDDFWKQDITAVVECEGFGVHGSPINGVVIEVKIN